MDKKFAKQELKKTVAAFYLFDSSFREDDVRVEDRIGILIEHVPSQFAADYAVIARMDMGLRHAAYQIVFHMARSGNKLMRKHAATTLAEIIRSPEEILEFVRLCWLGTRTKSPFAKQVKKGLALAFHKFSEEQFIKHNRYDPIRFRDVMALVHPRPVDKREQELFRAIANDKLPVTRKRIPTLDMRYQFNQMLDEQKLDTLELVNNFRLMLDLGVNIEKIKSAIQSAPAQRIGPRTFLAMRVVCPYLSEELSDLMLRCLTLFPKLPGKTVVLVDVSMSMMSMLHNRLHDGVMTRKIDAGCSLAILAKAVCEDVMIYSFSRICTKIDEEVRGLDMWNALVSSQQNSDTFLDVALKKVDLQNKRFPYRLLVITDDRIMDESISEISGRAYFMDVSSLWYGVRYGRFTHISGFSESVFEYIKAIERLTT